MEANSPRFKLVAFLLLVSIVQLSNAQSLCRVPISGLMSCKPAVTAPNPKPPSAPCCAALTNADLKCLCSYKNSQLLPSLGIDPHLAMLLPQKCNLARSANC